ncbi:hypothetical protein [Fulvivirga imtechensis]|uniref:hypothetical protein n=1 Tax=Fulvivirga imtechensis TaxID=881893 RepID=UPI0005900E54|nr:hypothetical protein [Fulvivirga imtechensis]
MLKSENGLVYVTSWYLNIICPDWEALIEEREGEYYTIAPLLGQQKWGIKFHPKPPLVQQLGIVSIKPTTEHTLKEVVEFLKRKYLSFSYPISNTVAENIRDIEIQKCNNHILSLNRDYKTIFSTYRRDRKARIKQGQQQNISLHFTDNIDQLLELFQTEVTPKIVGGVSESSIEHIQSIAKYALKKQCGFILEALNNENKVISIGLFLKFKNRIIYLIAATTKEGKILQANSLLLDHVIATHAQKPLILDFEGSIVPGIADFYRSFGAEVEEYFLLMHIHSLGKLLFKIKSIFHK